MMPSEVSTFRNIQVGAGIGGLNFSHPVSFFPSWKFHFASSSDWFTALLACAVMGQSTYFSFVFFLGGGETGGRNSGVMGAGEEGHEVGYPRRAGTGRNGKNFGTLAQ